MNLVQLRGSLRTHAALRRRRPWWNTLAWVWCVSSEY